MHKTIKDIISEETLPKEDEDASLFCLEEFYPKQVKLGIYADQTACIQDNRGVLGCLNGRGAYLVIVAAPHKTASAVISNGNDSQVAKWLYEALAIKKQRKCSVYECKKEQLSWGAIENIRQELTELLGTSKSIACLWVSGDRHLRETHKKLKHAFPLSLLFT